MPHGKDQILLRTKDVSISLLICSLLGIIGTQFKKVYRWDEAADRISALELRLVTAERTAAVVNSQLEGISKQLDQINWQLRRMNRGRDS